MQVWTDFTIRTKPKGTIGVVGVLGGLVPVGILFAPAVASKIMLNPKFSNLIFKEQAKLIAKGENTSSKMGVLYRQIVGLAQALNLFNKGGIASVRRK